MQSIQASFCSLLSPARLPGRASGEHPVLGREGEASGAGASDIDQTESSDRSNGTSELNDASEGQLASGTGSSDADSTQTSEGRSMESKPMSSRRPRSSWLGEQKLAGESHWPLPHAASSVPPAAAALASLRAGSVNDQRAGFRAVEGVEDCFSSLALFRAMRAGASPCGACFCLSCFPVPVPRMTRPAQDLPLPLAPVSALAGPSYARARGASC